VDVPIDGDVNSVLKAMTTQIKASERKPDGEAQAKWWQQIEEWRAKDCLKYSTKGKLIKPQHVPDTLYKVTKDDALVTSDVRPAPDVGGAVLQIR